MISEKIVSSEFNGFWREAFPLLTPSFVKVFNEAHCEDLTNLPSSKFMYVAISPEVQMHDLVAEFAFCSAEASHVAGKPVSELARNPEFVRTVYDKSVKFLERYRAEEGTILLNDTEIKEGFEISKQYENLFSYLDSDYSQIFFRPKIRGAGFLGDCTADLSAGDTLYEVKAISRNLSGRDIRQLIVYLALRYASEDPQWQYAGFFNPRRALHYRFSVEHLIYRTSGGKSKVDVFDQLLQFLDSRGVELDTPF